MTDQVNIASSTDMHENAPHQRPIRTAAFTFLLAFSKYIFFKFCKNPMQLVCGDICSAANIHGAYSAESVHNVHKHLEAVSGTMPHIQAGNCSRNPVATGKCAASREASSHMMDGRAKRETPASPCLQRTVSVRCITKAAGICSSTLHK
jgi:hypothetical protein